MKEPTQEIKEFWEYFGQKVENRSEYGRLPDWGYPPITLDNLFKWAVPKLQTTNEIVIILPPGDTERAIVRIGWKEGVDMPTLKDALFWAIYRVIKEEKMK
jgi:hypothetical protein